jgi:hypothetical protein
MLAKKASVSIVLAVAAVIASTQAAFACAACQITYKECVRNVKEYPKEYSAGYCQTLPDAPKATTSVQVKLPNGVVATQSSFEAFLINDLDSYYKNNWQAVKKARLARGSHGEVLDYSKKKEALEFIVFSDLPTPDKYNHLARVFNVQAPKTKNTKALLSLDYTRYAYNVSFPKMATMHKMSVETFKAFKARLLRMGVDISKFTFC